MSKNSQKFSHVIPLLFVAFVLTSYVAIKTNSEQKVLGEKTEDIREDRKEIKEVKLTEVKSKLENAVNNEARTKKAEIKNEDGKVKLKIQNKEREFEYEDASLKLKIKEKMADSDNDDSQDDETKEKSIRIKPVQDELEIEGEKHDVRTNFPITVDQKANTISVTTPKGEVEVKELPSTAIENLVNNKVFTSVEGSEIKEKTDGSGDASLNVTGENRLKFLGIIPIRSKVRAEIDPTTGELTKLSTPWFVSAFGFLFSKN